MVTLTTFIIIFISIIVLITLLYTSYTILMSDETFHSMHYCLTQLIAISIRNIIVKKRNITATCCESFSHFMLIILLIFGYNLSKVVYHSDMSYYILKVKLPNEIYAVFDALSISIEK